MVASNGTAPNPDDEAERERLRDEIADLSYKLDDATHKAWTKRRAEAYLEYRSMTGVRRGDVAAATGLREGTTALGPRAVDWAIRIYRRGCLAEMVEATTDDIVEARRRRDGVSLEDAARAAVATYLSEAPQAARLAFDSEDQIVALVVEETAIALHNQSVNTSPS